MPNAEELKLRLSNLVNAAQPLITRIEAAERFGSAEELEEIGWLTMRLTALEELLSLFCEILLIRPELSGFHPPNKSVFTRQLSEKLSLYKSLTRACGILYGISTESIEKGVAAIKNVGEDRNSVVHGLLFKSRGGEIAFHGRGRDVPATLGELRSLTKRCHEAALELTTHFSDFYTEMVGRRSSHAQIESAVQNALNSSLKLQSAANTLRASTLKQRDSELALIRATRKLKESRDQLAVAKKDLRNARARERRRRREAQPRTRAEPGG